jgi:hypothetical protein
LDFEVPEVAFLPDLLSEFPTKEDETSKGLTQLSFLDFTTVDHGSGTGSPDPFDWTGDHPTVPTFKEWDDFQDQYGLFTPYLSRCL